MFPSFWPSSFLFLLPSMACAPYPSTCSVATGVAVAAPAREARATRARSTSGRNERIYMHCGKNMHSSRLCPLPLGKRIAQRGILWRTKRHVAHRPSLRHCHARARCSAPCTRAHARRARSSRTHHACAAPCVRRTMRARLASHAHAHTRLHIATGCLRHWPLADRRPARRWRTWREHALQTRSPSPLLARSMPHPHAVPAIHHRRCIIVRRDTR